MHCREDRDILSLEQLDGDSSTPLQFAFAPPHISSCFAPSSLYNQKTTPHLLRHLFRR